MAASEAREEPTQAHQVVAQSVAAISQAAAVGPLATQAVVREGFWKPWKLAVVALLLFLVHAGMIGSEQAGGDPNGLRPLVALLWVVLLVWSIVWALVRRR
jgi:hypothetical protein